MDINDSTGGAALNFEEFVKQLTDRLVSNLLFRETHSVRKEDTRTSNFSMLLLKTNFPLMTWSTSTSNSVTDTMMNKSGKSSTLLEDMELITSLSRNTTNSLRRNLTRENWVFDHLSFASMTFIHMNYSHYIRVFNCSLIKIDIITPLSLFINFIPTIH